MPLHSLLRQFGTELAADGGDGILAPEPVAGVLRDVSPDAVVEGQLLLVGFAFLLLARKSSSLRLGSSLARASVDPGQRLGLAAQDGGLDLLHRIVIFCAEFVGHDIILFV